MKPTYEEKIKIILSHLKKGDKSTTSIANQLNRNIYDTLELLEELEKKEKIIRITMGKYTYWRLKKNE